MDDGIRIQDPKTHGRSTTPFVKLLGVRRRVSLQVDEVGMAPVLLIFVAQSGREAAFIISTRIEGDNWDERQERDSPSPDYPEYRTPSYHTRTTNYLSNQVISLSRPYLNTAHPDEAHMQNYRRFG